MKQLFLSACALISALLLVETVVRGYLPVDQTPILAWDADAQLLIHAPNQTGVRYPSQDINDPVRYSINAQGWNAQFDYPARRDYTRHLAVIIGDSFVEALQVTPFESLGGQLNDKLNEPGRACNQSKTFYWRQNPDDLRAQMQCPGMWWVYPMGISGAPLSQYLQMARAAERRYHPDIIIVVLVHNDFIESYERPDNPVYESFWHTDGVKMIGPKVYQRRPWSTVMASSWATGRFTLQTLSRLSQPVLAVNWSMGVDVTKNLAQLSESARITDYLFGQFEALKSKTSLLFVMDAPRDAIERGDDPTHAPVFALNIMARQLAAAHGLRLLDLTALFQYAWDGKEGMKPHVPNSFPSDYHWNAYAHDLVARTILPYVVKQ